MTPYRKKARHRLILAVQWMVWEHGFNHVGVLTLSFGVPGSGRGSQATRELREQAKDLTFVQKRWHSFNTNVIAKRYPDWVCVLEPHKDGVGHLHVVVATKADIRTGTDVETLSNYRLPYWQRRGKHLRNEALAAEMLFFRDYGDFADYFGPRWHYYLGEVTAGIPIPLRLLFAKGYFENGVVAKMLNAYAANPFPYLDDAAQRQMRAVNAMLLRKFSDLAFDEAAATRWREGQLEEADEIDLGPLTDADRQADLLNASDDPF